MKDAISSSRLKLLHPKVRDIFQSFIEECELEPDTTLRITQGLRTIKEQDALYNQGRFGNSGKIVTNAKGGQSYHNYGLAIDLVEVDGKEVDWKFDMFKLKEIATKHGIKWGGDFKSIKDKPHFEISFGLKPSQLILLPRDEEGYVIF